jgi:hypothetical protein
LVALTTSKDEYMTKANAQSFVLKVTPRAYALAIAIYQCLSSTIKLNQFDLWLSTKVSAQFSEPALSEQSVGAG